MNGTNRSGGYQLQAVRGPGGEQLLSLSGRVSLTQSEGLLAEVDRKSVV